MNVFVTGGTGFIGSYVVNNLVQKGNQVTILARNPKKVPAFLNNPRIKLLQGLITDYDIIANGVKGNDAVVHIALGWGETPSAMLENDTFPSVKLFEIAINNGVKNILYTSSTAAVGDLYPQIKTDMSTRPLDLYGATKAATESYLLALGAVSDVKCNVIRPGYTFGNPVIKEAPMQPDRRFVDIVSKVKKGEPVNLVKNDGTQFIWAGDLALLYEHVLFSNYNRTVTFGLSSEFITWEDIARYTIDYTKSESEIVLEDHGWQKGGCWFDDSKIKYYLNREVKSFDQVKKHVRYIADN